MTAAGTIADTHTDNDERRSAAFFFHLVRHNAPLLIGTLITLTVFAMAIAAPLLATHDPTAVNPPEQLRQPDSRYWFGTDTLGMDIYSRVMYGSRIDLFIAISSVAMAILVGVPVGAVVGYYGGRVDDVMMRILDSVQAFPPFILAMAVVAAVGANMWFVSIVIAFINFPAYLRLVRAETLSRKASQYVEAAKCAGNSDFRIIFRHLLPNCLGPVITQAPMNAGWALLIAAGLSFIGLGVTHPTPEWGVMVRQGADLMISGRWWISFFPGVAIFLTVLGLNLLAEGLRDILDPKRVGQ